MSDAIPTEEKSRRRTRDFLEFIMDRMSPQDYGIAFGKYNAALQAALERIDKPSKKVNCVTDERMRQFHILWTKAVGQEHYDKDQWKKLELALTRLIIVEDRLSQLFKQCPECKGTKLMKGSHHHPCEDCLGNGFIPAGVNCD